MPGPPRTPTHLKLLRGNPGHQALRPEPQPLIPKTCPEPPPHIDGFALDEWRQIAPQLHAMGLLTRIDVPALAAYCYSFGQWRMAAEALAKMQANDPIMGGQLVRTKYGDAATNPLVSIVRKHAGDVVRYAGEFGLSALARSRLAAGIEDRQPPGGKFGGLIAGRRE
ncbi:phage terminase small subunit P27 family [Bradyrhizobium sp. USDA 313]|uniref:phage terminase small subunit P27 family n=1 Tax=Bradyrhizobium sp. USDA 313 TaxID=3156307 RepID=UPI003512CBBC